MAIVPARHGHDLARHDGARARRGTVARRAMPDSTVVPMGRAMPHSAVGEFRKGGEAG
jgi:hypothetical protein